MVRRPTDLTPSEKHLIYDFLVKNSSGVHKGKIGEAAASFGVCRRTIQKVWSAANKARLDQVPVLFKSKKSGVSRKDQLVLDGQLFERRCTIINLAKQLKVNKSTVGRWVRNGKIKAHTNVIKPAFTAGNQIQRLKYCLHAIQGQSQNNVLKFDSMHSVFYIDEKWFYMTRTSERYYMLPGEVETHRSCKKKMYISKVMFMRAVARSQYASDGSLIWDEKIEMFLFTQQLPAQRNNKNRLRGTMVTKPIDNITKEVIKACILTQVNPKPFQPHLIITFNQ